MTLRFALALLCFASSSACGLLAGGLISCDTLGTSGTCVEGEVKDLVEKQQVRALCDVAVGKFAEAGCSRAGVVAGCKFTTEFGERRKWYAPKATVLDKTWTVDLARADCANEKDNPQLIDASGKAL